MKQKVTELNGRKQVLEARLEDANKLLQFYMSKNKRLVDGKVFIMLFKDVYRKTS